MTPAMPFMLAPERGDEVIHHSACDAPAERSDDGLDAAFGAALTRTSASLVAYARRLTDSAADADDLLQDTMLRCWRARGSFLPGTNLVAWARAVMRNGFISGRRRARFHAELPDGALERLLSVPGGQEQIVELRDARWALGELSQEYREAVLLAIEGLSIEEGASRLDIPEGTFKSRVARARNRLRSLTENRDAYRPPVIVSTPERALPARSRRSWAGVMIG